MQRSERKLSRKPGATTGVGSRAMTGAYPVHYTDGVEKCVLLGQRVTRQGLALVLDHVEPLVRRRKWPLTEVRVSEQQDPEVDRWKYILVTLIFDTSFEQAEKHLRDLYASLEHQVPYQSFRGLEKTDKGLYKVLTEKIFLDTLAHS